MKKLCPNSWVFSNTTSLALLALAVVRCSSVAYALKSFTSGDLEGFDVILVHAANAAACGFDFRAIVETDLLIPVIYFLEEDYEATGDEADELLRTLQAAGSYIIKKPLDIDEVRTRLWTVIAFRKCDLETKASRGGVAGLGVGGKDEDRVHFKVVMKGRGRKRKGSSSSSKHGGSSGTAAAAGGHPSAKGKEKENVGSQQQQNDGRANKAQKNGGGEAYNLPQPNTTMTNGQQQHVQHQRKPSDDLFMQSVLRMLAAPPNNPKFFTNATVPSYNPMFFSNAAGPSSNAAAFGNTITTTSGAPAAASRTLYSAAAPALHPVARQQQHPSAHNNVIFGNIAPSSAAAPTMAAAAYEPPQFSQGISNKQQEEDVHPLLMFGPFLYQGPTPPPPPVAQQDMLAPPAAAGDRFTGGMAGGGMTGGAPAAAAAEAVAYGNEVNLPFLQPPNLGVEQDGAKEPDMYASMAPPMAPQHVVNNALDDVAMLELMLSDSFNNYSAGSSFVVPEDHQVLGMVSNLNELTTMAGGALGSNNVVSLTAPHQGLSEAPNGGSSNTATFMAPQDPGAARDGDNGDQQQQDVLPQLMFGSFPYLGSPQQDMAAPAAVGDLFAGGMAGGDTAGGSSSAAATEAGAYGNDVSLSFLQPPNIIAEQDGDDELAGLMAMDLSYAIMADPHPPMLPQHIRDDASGKAKMLDLLFSDDFNDDCSAGSSLVAPDDQAPGMASNLNELTALAGGAFGSSGNDTAFMAPHQLVLDNGINGSLMGSQVQDTGAAMEGDDDAGLTVAMLPSDQYEDDDTSFPLHALLGDLHGPMLEFNDADLDAIPDGGAGTSLVAGEEGGRENGLDNLAGIDIPHDVMQLHDFPFPQPKNKNNVRE
uniref:Response regulatory domain-containing protein n=1 Tax=Setaria italica TaxID=4555 RepID=K4A2A2_SETIT